MAAWDCWLSVLSPPLASVWGCTWPRACLSARGLGFRVNVPKLGLQRIECPCRSDHAEPSRAASCETFKGLCVIALGDVGVGVQGD